MLGMTILGAAISSGFFDQVQALDFIAKKRVVLGAHAR